MCYKVNVATLILSCVFISYEEGEIFALFFYALFKITDIHRKENIMAKAPKYKAASAYKSQYANQMSGLLNNVTNRQEFSYNPLEDANYQALAKVYNANGLKAQQDTLGQAAALNGGYNTSWATSASQQARNDYNQQLASLIPELEQTAYSRYYDNYNMNLNALGALQDADNTAYQKYRDSVADRQWLYGQNYQKYRDTVADSQWQKEYNLSKKRAARSGRRGRSSSGGSSRYGSYVPKTGGTTGGTTGGPNLKKMYNDANTKGAVALAKAAGKAANKKSSKKK